MTARPTDAPRHSVRFRASPIRQVHPISKPQPHPVSRPDDAPWGSMWHGGTDVLGDCDSRGWGFDAPQPPHSSLTVWRAPDTQRRPRRADEYGSVAQLAEQWTLNP